MDVNKVANLLRQAASELESSPSQTNPSPASPSNSISQPSTPVPSATTNVRQELGRIFLPYNINSSSSGSSRATGAKRITASRYLSQRTACGSGNGKILPKWSHKFFCLSTPDQDYKPDKAGKMTLLEAGLGEKRVVFDKINDPEDFRETLYKKYPRLSEGGGFELLRTSGRYNLDVIPPSKNGYTAEYLSDSCALNQSTVYIRPLQKELDIAIHDDEPSSDCPLETCLICNVNVPVIQIKQHVKMHQKDDDLPVIKRKKITPICKFTCVSEDIKNEDEIKTDDNTLKVMCPICGKEYPKETIQCHAELCSENLPVQKNSQEENDVKNCQDRLITLNEALKERCDMVLKDDNNIISVVRRHFLPTAMDNLEDVDFTGKFHIIFIGEEGIDSGGLTREFFSLLFKKSPVFENGSFSVNSDLLQKKIYVTIGKAAAFSILTGNQGPQCLLPHITDFILNDKEPSVDAIPDDCLPYDMLQILKEIQQSNDDNSLNTVFERYVDVLESVGYRKVLKITTKDEAVHAIKYHYGYCRFLPSMLQFKEGLRLHDVSSILSKFHTEAVDYFNRCSAKSADLINLFKPCFSIHPEERTIEEMIIYNFHQFVKKIERGRLTTNWIEIEDDITENDVILNIDHIMVALTGSRQISPNISEALIVFDHENEKLSTVNTCAPSLTFNQTKAMQNYDFFEKSMINIIVCAYGFGIN